MKNLMGLHDPQMSSKSVLFVCLGNVIRSPLCEGLLKTRVIPGSVTIDSAAVTTNDLDCAPAANAQTIAREHGFDISDHISRLVCDADFDNFDLMVAMEPSVQKTLLCMKPNGSKTQIIELVRGVPIPNPWHKPYNAFVSMYEKIEPAMEQFIQEYIPPECRRPR
jgi:protein-tyrosine phosphatase